MSQSLRWIIPAKPWEGNGPCKDCGGRNFPWSTAHELWESVMECDPGAGGVICARCFVIRAHAKGIGRGFGHGWYLVPKPERIWTPRCPYGSRDSHVPALRGCSGRTTQTVGTRPT